MQLARYITYNEIYGIDTSYNDSIFFIKQIIGKYKKELVLSFLGYLSKEIGLENNADTISSLQLKLDIKINGILIHTRSILVLHQIFYETNKYTNENSSEKIESKDIFNLFLYANQILTKTDTPTGGYGSSKITIGSLMTAMRMHVGVITPFDVKLMEELFIKFYKRIIETEEYNILNSAVLDGTEITIDKFLEILNNFTKGKSISGIFGLYDKFSVMELNDIYNKWINRKPKIKIPNDYRFLETYPLIKNNGKYFACSLIILFMATARKIYHVLSANKKSKGFFRTYWGKNIVEPVIKEYIKDIFKSENVQIIDIDFQKEVGEEIADLVIIWEDKIHLIEIKSGYMALEHRFSDNESDFKENFEKKYIFNTSGKNQLVNQLDIFDNKYKKFSVLCGLNSEIKYKVFSCLLVFDEALSILGFKRYITDIYNELVMNKMNKYENIEPFFYPNLMTFVELLNFKYRIKDKNKRMTIFHNSYVYHDSITEFFDDIKAEKIPTINGILKDDID